MYLIKTDISEDSLTTASFDRAVKLIKNMTNQCKKASLKLPTFTITSDKWEHISSMEAYIDEASGLLVVCTYVKGKI